MTDFFADLERELRQAHRRDTRQPRRIAMPSIRPLLAAARRGLFTQAKRLYKRAVIPRPSHDFGPGPILEVAIPGGRWRASRPSRTATTARDAWIQIDERGVLGIAPDGPRQVIFDTGQPNGPESLTVADNAFGGPQLYLYPAKKPGEAGTRFEP